MPRAKEKKMPETTATPSLSPPAAGESGSAATGQSEPTLNAPAASQMTNGGTAVAEREQPKLRPGETGAAAIAALGAVTGTWSTGALIDAMWSANEIRNAWMHVASVGWKKIFNGTDGAFMALTALASQARETGHTVNYRVEADGMVHEIYLW
jgi:hypothetical protein